MSKSNSGTLSSLSAGHASKHHKTGRKRTPEHLASGSWHDIGALRERYWVHRLRRLAKRMIKGCYGCRRFQVKATERPPPGNLPLDRIEGSRPFQVVGVDFPGPIKYRVTQKKEGKAYIILYACSLTRGLYLELSKSMEASEFLSSLKRLVARKGRPEKIYSDNTKTFTATGSWLKQVQKDERIHH